MIDWLNLLSNSLWILGLAVGLAVIGLAHWEAQAGQQKMRQLLAHPGKQVLLDLAGVFFCAGLAATSSRWWEIALWLIMLAMFVLQVVLEVWKRIVSRQIVKDGENVEK